MEILLLILGLALVLLGANILTDGSANLAKRFGISEFVVGLTIVSIGTSAPELVVTIISSIKGQGDIAVGNIVGSNIFNTFIILGVTALILPVALTRNNIRKDIPYGLLASLVLFAVAGDTLFDGSSNNVITRSEGVLMLLMFMMFIAYSIFSAKISGENAATPPSVSNKKSAVYIVMIISGLGMLIYGGDLFINNAIALANKMGISQKIIAITLMAGGTSLPELAACVVAAVKKKGEMALGNVIGSNISNIFLILGTGAVITPLSIGDIKLYDLSIVVISSLLLFFSAFTFKGRKINRIEGIIFIAIYIAYIISIIK